ncbi:MAG: hypothetical protein WA510_21775 [Acidobacteriaceae bacterium]
MRSGRDDNFVGRGELFSTAHRQLINAGLGDSASPAPQLPPPANAPTISLENDDK